MMNQARSLDDRFTPRPRPRRPQTVVRAAATVVAAVMVATLLTGCQRGSPSERGKPAGWVPSALPAYTATVQAAAVRTREVKGYSRILTTTQGLSIYVNTFVADRPGELQGDLFITGSSSGRTYTWRAVRVPKNAPTDVVFKPRK
ncbi:hypothetical protein ABZV93_06245 [Actinopolymorpha sp. NPDC004070]|uniref:hypothetical protein n=1 Tax=Actinopolymorpha sp. NPDC004070 TaxID=3154548 RepID=UPI0033A58CDA